MELLPSYLSYLIDMSYVNQCVDAAQHLRAIFPNLIGREYAYGVLASSGCH